MSLILSMDCLDTWWNWAAVNAKCVTGFFLQVEMSSAKKVNLHTKKTKQYLTL